MTDVLTPEQLASALLAIQNNVSPYNANARNTVHNSHEALRAKLAACEAERDELKAFANKWIVQTTQARIVSLEQERDDWRRKAEALANAIGSLRL